MHHAGARHLLRFGAILETEANIVSFSAFVLADLSIRASFVQTIAITLSLHWASSLCEDYVSVEREQMALESLAVVLRSADNLRTFRMDASQELLGMSSALGLALRNCRSLRFLHLGSCGKLTTDLLSGMQCTLDAIELDCRDFDIHSSHSFHPLTIIRKHCATVVKLIAQYAEIYKIEERVQLSSLRALALRDCCFLSLPALNDGFGRQGIEYLEINAREVRFHEDGDEIVERHRVWEDITYLCGSLDVLVWLQVNHSIKRLDIEGVTLETKSLERISALLAHCRPQRLVIGPANGWIGLFDIAKIPHLLPMPEGVETTRFVLEANPSVLRGTGDTLVVRYTFHMVTSRLSLTADRETAEKLDDTTCEYFSHSLRFPTPERKKSFVPPRIHI